MSRPRATNEHLIATGLKGHNKTRYADRGDTAGVPADPPLGDPPATLDIAEATAWNSIRSEMPWLCRSDTTLVIMAAKLRARAEFGNLETRAFNTLRGLVVELAGRATSKTERRKMPDDPTEIDEFDL